METHTLIPDTTVNANFAGRTFGATIESPHGKYNNPVFEVLMPLASELAAQSRLLTLSGDFDKSAVYKAYDSDITLLRKYQKQFMDFARAAVRCSIRPSATVKADEAWKRLEDQIPAAAKEPLLELSTIRAAKDARALLYELQGEFCQGTGRLLKQFSLWLQVLVENDFLGLIEWAGEDVAKYHYFRHELERSVTADHITNTHTLDQTKDYGERNTVTEQHVQEVLNKQTLERHAHTIVRARTYRLGEYRRAVPQRVALLINAAPKWLRRHLRIVDGQIVMEETIRNVVGEQAGVEVIKESVSKYSPALTLGDVNYTGWSGDDLRAEPVAYYKGQGWLRILNYRRYFYILFAVLLCIAAYFAYDAYDARQQHQKSVLEYQRYLSDALSGGVPVFTIKLHQTLAVPDGYPSNDGATKPYSVNLGYEGVDKGTCGYDNHDCWNLHMRTRGARDSTTTLPWSYFDGKVFGKIDGDRWGLYSETTVHVLSATPEEIRFTVHQHKTGW